MSDKKVTAVLGLILIFAIIKISNGQVPDTLKGASPFTSGHYVPGIWNIRDYATPPPGFYILDYNVFLSSSKFFNRDGNQVTELNGPVGTTSLDLDVSGYLTLPNFFYASSFKILDATYLANLTLSYSTVNSDLAYNRIAKLFRDTINNSGNINGNASGFGDMTIMPFGLSWASDQFNLTAMYLLVAPTGRYTPGGNDNVGLGYWTNTFQMVGYAYPMKIKSKPSQAMAIMAALTYEINSKIDGVDVTPGNRFTIEYGISQYLSDRFEIGIMGGNNFQITNDKGNDVWWNASSLDQLGYIGFQISGWPVVNKLYASVKYNVDYAMRERMKMHMLEFNLIYATGLLTGKTKKK